MSKALQKAGRAWRRWRFVRNGMKPWKTGYLEYKDDEISRVVREGTFSSNKLPAGYGFRLDERIIEYPWLFSRLPMGEGRLLDAGSTLNFEFLIEQPVLRRKKSTFARWHRSRGVCGEKVFPMFTTICGDSRIATSCLIGSCVCRRSSMSGWTTRFIPVTEKIRILATG